MKLYLSVIALFIISLFITSGYNNSVVGLSEGDFAPDFSVKNESTSLKVSDFRGDFVLLTFWASSDARSRVAANSYSTLADKYLGAPLRHISVNFDSSESLFSAIIDRDGMDADMQYRVEGDDARRIAEAYHLDGGYGSVLIGPDGRIIAFNPQASELSE